MTDDRIRVRPATQEDATVLAESRGGAIGYVTATVHRRAGDVLTRPRNFAAIEHIAVDPAAARGGAGSALVEAVRVAAREVGCTSLVTDVWAVNKTALAFFEDGLGFAPMRHWLEQRL
ncbi:GNAT family N-acetyltransferase [Nonomuraea sp. KM90]|uniref:GNAT family N-acetyltransferase n=1 Tax=Nonomuraea sp. KM90 TaxID=3457428 RepID=UPI003FCECCA9